MIGRRPRPVPAGPTAGMLSLFLSAVPAAAPANGADVTGYGLLTTDYVYRGVSYSDGHSAAQAAVDAAFESGVYFGAWASTVDIGSGAGHERDAQVNYYLGLSREWGRKWLVGANVVAHTFPGARGNVDYDYVEWSIVASYDDRAWLEYSYSDDLFHTGRHTHNVELYAEWPLPANVMLGGGAGYYDTAALTGLGYGYWQVGLTCPVGPVSVDLRYHDSNRNVPIISTPETAGSRLVLSVKLPF